MITHTHTHTHTHQTGRFVFSTPYTASGKAHGELDAQYIRKTILTTQDSFPYVKKRSKIIQVERIELTPLEVAILNMQEKTKSLRHAVQQDPPDTKLLQMQLQGGIATAVNQVRRSGCGGQTRVAVLP